MDVATTTATTATVPNTEPTKPEAHTESIMNPVPMSFPAFLRNAKLADRFAHLRENDNGPYPAPSSLSRLSKRSREDHKGKRWVRRKENARFTGNPHIVAASAGDLLVPSPYARLQRLFPEPPPRGFSRTMSAPTPSLPMADARSADAGRYSLSIRGVRRTLRGHGPRAQRLVHAIEREVLEWLVGGTMLNPDDAEVLHEPGREIGVDEDVGGCIIELSRTPLKLIWSIQEDAFARYIVHCCARYHKVVSYSKDVDGRRLTYLLRPNVVRPDFNARDGVATPPATESDYSSLGVLSETDILSVEENDPIDTNSDSEAAAAAANAHGHTSHQLAQIQARHRHRRLSSVSERSALSIGNDVDNVNVDPDNANLNASRRLVSGMAALQLEETTADADADDDDSVAGDALAQSIDSLDISNNSNDTSGFPSREPPIRYTTLPIERTPLRDRRGISRASSSPSRSPCPPATGRRSVRYGRNRIALRRTQSQQQQTFYDYVYA